MGVTGCQDCPDHNIEGVIYIVYTGGPAWAQYPHVSMAIANDPAVVRRFQPIVLQNGSIQYNDDVEPPPCPEGYERDPNLYTLKPAWPSCVYRLLCARQNDDGSLHVECRCLTPLSAYKGHETVSLDGCKACSVRQPIK